MAVYLDCNATTPLDPDVRKVVLRFLDEDFGNAGSRTHEFGARAKKAVDGAREAVADLVACDPTEVLFTSGATESNNLALLGLASHGLETGRKHLVSTALEHKAVLEPLAQLERRGFELTLVPPTEGGWVQPDAIRDAIRDDTLLVSVMHVNNETGVLQPLVEVAEALADHPCFVHTDAAQGYGKELKQLLHPRIDLISVSAHKVYGPKGVGALVTRRRARKRPPLEPLLYGGGQERGLRGGTLPVHLIAALGKASELASQEHALRAKSCLAYREDILKALAPLEPRLHGDQERALPNTLNLSFPGLDSEAVMLALRDLVAISNGSACTSQSYEPSHVLTAMALPEEAIRGALRISWSHSTEPADWSAVARRIQALL